MIEERARDFRLDAKLREACAADIDASCAFEKDGSQVVSNADGKVIACLQARARRALQGVLVCEVHPCRGLAAAAATMHACTRQCQGDAA
jgi:Cysteine rich repeat